ncbi:MAG: DUF5906 domain-containing protein [Desulfobacterales bacterium]
MKKEIIQNYFIGNYQTFYTHYLPQLGKAKGDQLKAICPFHNDENPSLSINYNTGLFNCFGCDASGNIYDFYAKMKKLDTKRDFPKILEGICQDFGINNGNGDKKKLNVKQLVVARYDYRDETGDIRYQIERLEPGRNGEKKEFRIRRPDGNGGWIYNKGDVRIIPYNLPEVLKADEILIAEGEKDCDNLKKIGFTVTTNPFGAGKWPDNFGPYFAGKHIILLPDNDESGRMHMHKVAANLKGHAASIKWIELPNLPEKGDVSDFIAKFSNDEEAAERLAIMIDGAELYKPLEDNTISDDCHNHNHDTNDNSQQMDGDKDDVANAIELLNEKHAILMMGGKCVILNETFDPIFNRPDINFSSTQDFKTYYKNKKIEVLRNRKLSQVSIADFWLDSPYRKQYKGIVFDPSMSHIPDFYNLYRGFAIKPQEGSWELMQQHIKEIICSGDDESFRYLMAWMARMVQDPGGNRPGVVIVLRGKQGTGKGCFATNFGAIFGSHFLHIISYTLVAGRFNSHFKDALLVFVDEGFWGGDKQAEGVLKGMITEDFILVEPKGKDAFKIKNHANFIFASNHDWVVPAAFEERRFFTIDVADKRMNDRKYFSSIYEEMENGGRAAMLFDLLHYDISNFDLRNFPRREALLDQITQTMSSVKKFWFEQLRHGGIISISDQSNDHSSTDWPDTYNCAKLYKSYLEFASTIGERYKPIDKQFGKQLRELCPAIKRKKKLGVWHYFLPTLSECRAHFESLVKIKIDWDTEENQPEGEY